MPLSTFAAVAHGGSWPDAEVATCAVDFRLRRYCGLVLLTSRLTGFDPVRLSSPLHQVTMSVSQSRLCEAHPARSNARPFRGLVYPNWSNSSRFSALIARQAKSAMPTIISISSAAREATPGSLAPRRMQVSLKSEYHQHHVLTDRRRLGERPFIPTRPTAECQCDVLLSIHRVGHRIAGELRSGFEAP